MDPLWILLIGMAVVMGGILFLRLHAFLALFLGAFIVAAITPSSAVYNYGISKKLTVEAAETEAKQTPIERVTREFGAAAGRIGLLIALGTILGRCLLESGGADRIVRSILAAVGQARASIALLISSFMLGSPVFFETAFMLLIPIGKALRAQTKRDFTLYVLSTIAGATMTHSLVPPTPGPLFVATELNISLGTMILCGCLVGAMTSSFGWLVANKLNRIVDVPLRDETITEFVDEKLLPPLWLALLPIALPVILIVTGAYFDVTRGAGSLWLKTFTDAKVALSISVAISLATLLWQGKSRNQVFSKIAGAAIEDAGSIVLIVSAGGAFGGALQQCGIGARMVELSTGFSLGILPLAWLMTGVVRTTSGSATVAMVAVVGIVKGMAAPETLGFHPVWLAMAIGCGSKMIPWMNDGGFWVVAKTSRFTEKEMLKTMTPMVSSMGIVGLIVVMILAKIFPMK